ncbi:hypothetical protein GT204_03730 [Streptomyces sp. SID4919]|uniref:hypothetical protein n=1 Tax=unclassified Streptomyces TaxID=2593676 RepID=UPI000823CA02|nr:MULTISPECIES: hypothetical protein [unclassified Streptomyces]MYY08030.1 hypothetical protein [Streptomyces sp. SID4919]SCK08188.1 hypothetical protein YW7DRAFT_00342 [Streptomyces sp. AmelKG-E11A]
MTGTPLPPQGEPRFPAFTAHPSDTARRQARAAAAALARHRTTHGSFPEPGLLAPGDLLPAPAGSLVFVDAASDLSRSPGFRLHTVPDLLNAIQEALGGHDPLQVEAEFEAAVRDTCWGALALTLTSRAPAPAAALRARLTTVLRCWRELAALRYVDHSPVPVPLDALITRRCAGLTAMWLPADATTGDPRHDLPAALDALDAADEETRTERSVRRLRELAATNPRIRHPGAVSAPDLLREELAALDQEEREALAAGDTSAALTVLHGADRHHDDTHHR